MPDLLPPTARDAVFKALVPLRDAARSLARSLIANVEAIEVVVRVVNKMLQIVIEIRRRPR